VPFFYGLETGIGQRRSLPKPGQFLLAPDQPDFAQEVCGVYERGTWEDFMPVVHRTEWERAMEDSTQAHQSDRPFLQCELADATFHRSPRVIVHGMLFKGCPRNPDT
jgi:hypothetical protein